MNRKLATVIAFIALSCAAAAGHASGTLTAKGSPHAPIRIKDHHVNIVINNGFSRTEVIQIFFNPNPTDLEAIYAFPLPKSASLSEVTIYIGEVEINGEVVERVEARQIYEEERDKGNDAGLAEKNGYQTFQFNVSPVRANAETRIRFVYYQPLQVDTGVGRYLYPLEEGGTDDVAPSFWVPNTKVEGTISIDLELKSAWPIDEVRVPGFETAAAVTRLDEGHYKVRLEREGAHLDRDFVFYYRLAENLPGRIELIAHRADKDKPGTFMMVVTPGLDLKPITGGSDYAFVLDVSGSMRAKLHTLGLGVIKALNQMSPEDRFRIVTFNNSAGEITRGWTPATPEAIAKYTRSIEALASGGSTNLFDGLSLGLRGLDDDRATSIILVTDAVTNTGVVDPAKFHKMMRHSDVRVFAFMLGNSGNRPLMETITAASGGFSADVSNADDIIGQILLAKSKITHESLHDASIKIRGVKVFDTTDEYIGKVYRGRQLVLFGRYAKGGEASVRLEARMTGEDRVYKTTFEFPEIATDSPEIERLWAMNQIEQIEAAQSIGAMHEGESRDAVRDLGLAYQLVTDHTSMVVLSDEAFDERGIARSNRERVARERQARSARASQPAVDRRVDRQAPAFKNPAPRLGGGGALDPITGGIALTLAGLAAAARRRKRSESDIEQV